MSDTPNLEALARRYLDLWQDQMARMATDPATADMLARTFTMMTQATVAAAAPQAANPGGSANDHEQSDAGSGVASPPHGTKAAADVSGAGGVDVSKLLRRIDALEERVAALENTSDRRRPARPGRAAGK